MKVYVIVLSGNVFPEKECYTTMKAAAVGLGMSIETVRRFFKDGYYTSKRGSIYLLRLNKIFK